MDRLRTTVSPSATSRTDIVRKRTRIMMRSKRVRPQSSTPQISLRSNRTTAMTASTTPQTNCSGLESGQISRRIKKTRCGKRWTSLAQNKENNFRETMRRNLSILLKMMTTQHRIMLRMHKMQMCDSVSLTCFRRSSELTCTNNYRGDFWSMNKQTSLIRLTTYI